MLVKVCIGVSQKVGAARHGSPRVACRIECELDEGTKESSDALQAQVQRLYIAAAQAVQHELARRQHAATAGTSPVVGGADPSCPGGRIMGTPFPRTERPATLAQRRAIRALARTQDVDLDEILIEIFEVSRVEELCVEEASRLIRQLRT